jgi:hypothetical protein
MMVYLCHIPILSFCIVLGINVLMLISVVIDKIKGKEDK